MMEQLIRAAILRETERITEEEAKLAAERVEKRVRGMTAQIAATVVSKMSVEAFGTKALKIIVEFNPE